MKTIQRKLILFSISLVAFPILIVSIGIGLLIRSNTIKQFEESTKEQMETIDRAISLLYEELDNDINMFAGHAMMDDIDISITTYSGNGQIEMTPSTNGGIEEAIYNEFQNYAETHLGTQFIYLGTEFGGYIQWPEDTVSTPYDPRIRPWYESALDGNGSIVRTGPYEVYNRGTLIVSNTRTVIDSNGNVIGVIGIDVSSEKLTEIIKDIKIGENGYTMLLHRAGNGMILADPRNPENNNRFIIPTEDTSKNMAVPIEGLEKLLDPSVEGFSSRIGGNDYIVLAKHSNETDWTVAAFIDQHEATRSVNSAYAMIAIIAALLIVLAGGFALFASRRISKPIRIVASALSKISEKNFLVQINSEYKMNRDETGVLANAADRLIQGMSTVIKDVRASSGEVSKASVDLNDIARKNTGTIEETSRAIEMLAQKTSEQAEDSKSILYALKDIEKQIDAISDDIKATTDIAARTLKMSTEASGMMKDLDAVKMTSLSKIRHIGELIDSISENANHAEDFTSTIEKISTQTNLLALNASIEAARAGETGKGFAVVAEEIRKLSDETNQATIDIKALIQGILNQSTVAVSDMEAVGETLDELSKAISDSEDRFTEAGESMKTVMENFQKVFSSSLKLSSNKDDVLKGISSITDAAANNSATAEEVSAAVEEEKASMQELERNAENLKNIAGSLEKELTDFKL